MKITVNGRGVMWPGLMIDYGNVLSLADQPQGASVTYVGMKKGDTQRSGFLHAQSQPLFVEEGMVFNAIVTGNA